MINNMSLSIITSAVVNDSVDLVLPDPVIVTVTDDEQVEDRERHKHKHAESPQSRSWTHRLVSRGIQVLHGAVEVRVTVSFLVGGVQMEHTLVDAADLAVVIARLHCNRYRSHGGGRGGHGWWYAHDDRNDRWGMRRRWRGA